jgi:hypothetical protein
MDGVIAHGSFDDYGGASPSPHDLGGVEGVVLAVFEEQRARLRGFFVRAVGVETPPDDLLQETLLRTWDHRGAVAAAGTTAAGEVKGGARCYLWRVARPRDSGRRSTTDPPWAARQGLDNPIDFPKPEDWQAARPVEAGGRPWWTLHGGRRRVPALRPVAARPP